MKFERCELTKEQAQKWSDTRVALSWNCPAFTHIFMTMLDTVGSEHIALFTKDPRIPVAATDGASLIINPDGFFKWTLQERLFIVAHEILHCILNHCILMHRYSVAGSVAYPDGVKLPYISKIMNVAEDLVINDILIDAKVGSFNRKPESGWLHDPQLGNRTESSTDVYRKLYEEAKRRDKGRKPGEGGKPQPGDSDQPSEFDPLNDAIEEVTSGGKRFDEHLQPGASQNKDPHQAAKEHNQVEWDTAIAAAANVQRLQGKMPAGLERLFGEILEPKVDWKEKIEALFARKVGTGRYDWQRPDKRLIVRDIYAPGRSGFGAGVVVVGVDTSGSVGPKEVDMFLAEVSGILETVRPKELVAIWCDAYVHRVDHLEEPSDLNAVRCKGAPGGGGTDFRPVFDWVEENCVEPDAVVYLTDGYGSFPQIKPKYTVIWGSITDNPAIYPWGDVVVIPKQAQGTP